MDGSHECTCVCVCVLALLSLCVSGVFGAGKSFLLSVLIMFLVELFQRNDSYSPSVPFPWKILLSSTTNVAVDRVLQGYVCLDAYSDLFTFEKRNQ